MANYNCTVRTNYFHVKDEKVFRDFMNMVEAEDLEIWEEKDRKGEKVFGFGGYGAIYGLSVKNNDDNSNGYDDCDYDYDAFLGGLQKLVTDDDAIIITEVGHEKLRYLTGICWIVTSKKIDYVNLMSVALAKARKMLDNESYSTQMEY